MHETQRRALQILGFEHGMVLWLPSVLVAAALVLFAIRQAPAGHNLFNQAGELRVAVGPVVAADDARDGIRAFEAGLARGLRAQRELTLVDAEHVRARLLRVLGDATPSDPQRWLRGSRSLNLLYAIAAHLERDADFWQARVEVWDVSSERPVHDVEARAPHPEALGIALADSIGIRLFQPVAARAAWR